MIQLNADAAIKLKLNQRAFETAYAGIQAASLQYVQQPKITTTTLLLTFATQFDLSELQSSVGNSGRFSNQRTLKVGNASVKVFENGKVHVTGTRSVAEACLRVQHTLHKKLVLTDFDFQMINVKFKVQQAIVLSDFIEKATRYLPTVFYDPTRYPGVRVKMLGKGTGTVLVFATGSILLTGANTPKSLEDMMRFVANCLGSNEATNLTDFSHWRDNVHGVVIL